MSPVWSYVLAAIGITGLLIAATRPRVGWWFNIVAQLAWVTYAVVTRQWGFLASAVAYGVAYARLLRKAYRPAGHFTYWCDHGDAAGPALGLLRHGAPAGTDDQYAATLHHWQTLTQEDLAGMTQRLDTARADEGGAR